MHETFIPYIIWIGTGNTIPSKHCSTEYIGLEMKYREWICPLSWSVHCNFVRDGKYSERVRACTPPPSPAWTNFSIMECKPESGRCHSVCTLWYKNQKSHNYLLYFSQPILPSSEFSPFEI
jgi:hypothetical protein